MDVPARSDSFEATALFVPKDATQAPPRIDPLRALTGVALFSALGMLLGYARDASLAAVFGASALTDAFFVATIIPTIVATVVMSGALAPALLPVFRSRLEQRTQAWALANTLLCWGGVILALFVAAIFVSAPWLVAWLAPGASADTAALAIHLTQLGAPMLFMLGMSALMGALANALGSFRLPALATVLVNGAAFLAILTFGREIGIASAVLGLTLGALLQMLAQAVGLYRQGWRPSFAFDWQHADVRETLRLFLPLVAFVALAQSVPIVERVLSSSFPTGELSLLAYAGKLFQIPGVVLSSSLAIVLYPHLIQVHTDAVRDETPAHWNESLAQAVRSSLFLTLPLALWFLTNAGGLVRLIFQRGAFSPQAADTTAVLVQIYMLAVVPAGILLVLTRALHAQRKMRLTLLLGVFNTLAYIIAAFVCARAFGLNGLPLAFCISQMFGCVLFARFAFRGNPLRLLLNRSLAANCAAALVIAILLVLGSAFANQLQGVRLLVGICLSLAITGLVYLGLAAWWGSDQARVYLNMTRQALARLRRRPLVPQGDLRTR